MSAVRWEIDSERSTIAFKVRHLVISVTRGTFRRFAGHATVDEDLSRSTVEVQIDTGSVDTGQRDRDDHLRSELFVAALHPFMRFRSTGVEARGTRVTSVTGSLSIKDVTRPVELRVERFEQLARMRDDSARIRVVAKTSMLRSEFGLVWNAAVEAGGLAVSDKVEVELDVVFARAGTAD